MTPKTGETVKVRLLTKDGKSQEIVERQILMVGSTGSTIRIKGLDGKERWVPAVNIVDEEDDVQESKMDSQANSVNVAETPKQEEEPIAVPVKKAPKQKKAKTIVDKSASKASKKIKPERKVKVEVPLSGNKALILEHMTAGKSNAEIHNLIPDATLSYIKIIRNEYFQWEEPKEGTTKRAIIDLYREGLSLEEIQAKSGSTMGHVRFQVKIYKRFHS